MKNLYPSACQLILKELKQKQSLHLDFAVLQFFVFSSWVTQSKYFSGKYKPLESRRELKPLTAKLCVKRGNKDNEGSKKQVANPKFEEQT